MADQPVPPFPTRRMPVMSAARLTREVATAPAVALRKPVRFAREEFEVKRLVELAVVENKLVVVAEVPVAFRKVKFWRVVEPVARMFANVPRPVEESVFKNALPETVSAVEDAYGKVLAVVVVPVKYAPTISPTTESFV